MGSNAADELQPEQACHHLVCYGWRNTYWLSGIALCEQNMDASILELKWHISYSAGIFHPFLGLQALLQAGQRSNEHFCLTSHGVCISNVGGPYQPSAGRLVMCTTSIITLTPASVSDRVNRVWIGEPSGQTPDFHTFPAVQSTSWYIEHRQAWIKVPAAGSYQEYTKHEVCFTAWVKVQNNAKKPELSKLQS